MNTNLILLKSIAAGAALGMLAGCAPMTPNLDRQFGTSVNIIKAQQTIDPDASRNTRMVTLDGDAANRSVERYVKSYSAPTPQPNVFTIGVGGGGN